MPITDTEIQESISRIDRFATDLTLVITRDIQNSSAVSFWWEWARRVEAILNKDEKNWSTYVSVDAVGVLQRIRELVGEEAE